jgi:hypothetical protein
MQDAGRILIVLVGELVEYIAIVFRLPVLLGAIALAATVVITLQDFYPRVFAVAVSPLLGFLPQHFEFELPDLVKASVFISLAWYVLTLVLRLWRGDRPPMRYRVQLVWVTLFVTVCWGFVLAHLPWMRVAPGASRTALGWIFVGFYLLTLVSFAAGVTFSWSADRVLDIVRRHLDPEPHVKGGVA